MRSRETAEQYVVSIRASTSIQLLAGPPALLLERWLVGPCLIAFPLTLRRRVEELQALRDGNRLGPLPGRSGSVVVEIPTFTDHQSIC